MDIYIEKLVSNMNKLLRKQLIGIAREKVSKKDPSHDINHALRVLAISEKIAKEECADFDVIIPAALFHDVINYPKNHRKRMLSSDDSAEFTKNILKKIKHFPKQKINKVFEAIKFCSFSKNIIPDFIEAKILQDGDSLEATGTMAVMRTFSSAGIMNKTFYDVSDPFCKKRRPDDNKYALDLFFTRLLLIKDRLHTQAAKKLATDRNEFLNLFLRQLNRELIDDNFSCDS